MDRDNQSSHIEIHEGRVTGCNNSLLGKTYVKEEGEQQFILL